MKVIPVDSSRLQVLVVGQPQAAVKGNGEVVLDRDTGRPQWNIDVTVIGEARRAETEQLGVPEGGFPKDLGIGAFIVPEGWTVIKWENDKGQKGEFVRAKSVKVVGGAAALKSVAA